LIGSVEVGPGFGHPLWRAFIFSEIEQPPKESKAILLAKAKARSVGSKLVSERAGIVEDEADRLRDQMSYRFRIFIIPKEVGGNSRRSCHWKSFDIDPFLERQLADVDSNVGSSSLSSPR